jgi:hypothetical protein
MNKLIVVGWTGVKKAYLNVSKEEAMKRYCLEDDTTTPEELLSNNLVSEFEFDTEFSVYDAWK